MTGNVERVALTSIRILVKNGTCRWAAVADLEDECLANRHAVRVGRGHCDRVAAEVGVGRHT